MVTLFVVWSPSAFAEGPKKTFPPFFWEKFWGDFRNAFNSVDRSAFLSSVHRSFPGLYAWTEWCYGSPTVLLYNHSDIILSSCGVQQGDPLGPFLFSLVLAPIIEKIQALSPDLNLWYLDDGVIVGPPMSFRRLGM